MTPAVASAIEALVPLLRCPSCGQGYQVEAGAAVPSGLRCLGCDRRVPLERGIPRFLTVAGDDLGRRTQASFGYEWTEFHNWTASGPANFEDYFSGLNLDRLRDARVLDAGCGMGRHARQLAPYCRQLIAVDFSRAIEAAAANLEGVPNVHCLQADLQALPLAHDAFDFVYSLGVLHHLEDTAGVLRRLVEKARPGGRVRIYLYWRRHGVTKLLLGVASLLRVFTTRLPLQSLKAFSWAVSVLLAGFVIAPYRLLARAGVAIEPHWPLAIYVKYPFEVLFNDQFDRLSAPLEKRYDPDEVRELLEGAGLTDVQVFAKYGWIGEGIRAR